MTATIDASASATQERLLRMIAGLELPTSGRILLDGEDVTFQRAAKRDIAFVFQLFALYPHMKVHENLTFPLRTQGTPRREVKERLAEVAKLLEVTERALWNGIARLAVTGVPLRFEALWEGFTLPEPTAEKEGLTAHRASIDIRLVD